MAPTDERGLTNLRMKRRKDETTSRVEKAIRAFAILLAAMAFLVVGAYGFMLWFIEEPEPVRPSVMRFPAQTTPASGANESGAEDVIALPVLPEYEQEDGWRSNVHTILLAGEDDGFGGTDVIMLILFDQGRGSIDVLSIPRDTIVNVPWNVKRINSIQNLFRRLPGDYDHYIHALSNQVSNLVGYPIDYWVTLDLGGFIELVDAIGGIYFDVPQRMRYSDPYQSLFIDLHPGYQLLDGEAAMGLVRFRSYPQGDIQRIRVQHDFLRALSSQLLQARNILAIGDLIRVFRDNVDTDLSTGNLLWFATEFLQMESENIRFHAVDHTIANINESVNGASYVSLFVEPWVELINRYMNPFTREIRVEDLEILTRDPVTRQFFTTNGAPILGGW